MEMEDAQVRCSLCEAHLLARLPKIMLDKESDLEAGLNND